MHERILLFQANLDEILRKLSFDFCSSVERSVLSNQIFLQETSGSLNAKAEDGFMSTKRIHVVHDTKRWSSQCALKWVKWNQHKYREIKWKLYEISETPRFQVQATIQHSLVKTGPVSMMFCVTDRLSFIMLVHYVSSSGVDSVCVCVCWRERQTGDRERQVETGRKI